MASHSGPKLYQLACPLCGQAVQVTHDAGDSCAHCGAQLDAFDNPTDANQFAEEAKARGETATWQQVFNGNYWVVGHKGTPTYTEYHRDSADRD